MTRTKAQKAKSKARGGGRGNGKGKGPEKGPAAKVERKPAFARSTNQRPPQGVLVEQDEFVTNVNGSVAFSVLQYECNPGQAAAFPWLHQQAKLFEKYTVLGLEYYYKPMVSGYAAGGSVGKVMLMFDYDCMDNVPAHKGQVEAAYCHADGMPYETVRMRVNAAEANDHAGRMGKYVRSGAQPLNTDRRLYDAGFLCVCTEGQLSGALIGELRVKYKLRLSVPQLETNNTPTVGPIALMDNVAQTLATTVVEDVAYGTLVEDGIGMVQGTIGWIAPAGTYLIEAAHDVATAADTLHQAASYIWDYTTGNVVGFQSKTQFGGASLGHQATNHARAIMMLDGATEIGARCNAAFTGTANVNAGRLSFVRLRAA